MSLDIVDDKSALIPVMAWCHQAQAITWTNVDPNLCQNMVLPGNNEYYKEKNKESTQTPTVYVNKSYPS